MNDTAMLNGMQFVRSSPFFLNRYKLPPLPPCLSVLVAQRQLGTVSILLWGNLKGYKAISHGRRWGEVVHQHNTLGSRLGGQLWSPNYCLAPVAFISASYYQLPLADCHWKSLAGMVYQWLSIVKRKSASREMADWGKPSSLPHSCLEKGSKKPLEEGLSGNSFVSP